MSKIQVIRAGESLDFVFDRGGASLTGWTCNIQVKQIPADTAILSRAVPMLDDEFPGFLTQTETSALPVGLYRIIALLSNTATDEEEQIPLRFNVTAAWQ